MKRKIFMILTCFLLVGTNLCAADGDLIVTGNVGVGTTSPSSKLEIYSGSGDTARLRLTGLFNGSYSASSIEWKGTDSSALWHLGYRGSSSGEAGNLSFWRTNDGTSWLSPLSLTPTGRVGIGTTNPMQAHKLTVIGSVFATDGFYPQSDAKFKKDVETIKSSLSVIEQLRGVSYKWKTDEYKEKEFSEGTHYGVIAQEIEQVLPDIVKTDDEGNKAVNYTELIPVLIEAIKELKADIETLKAKN
jgi:hypothetical protein